jgi:hypothetical protein
MHRTRRPRGGRRRGAACAALLSGAAALVAVPDLTAQEIPSPYRFIEERQFVTLFGGPMFTNPGELELGPHSGIAVGGRYGIRLGGPFALDAGLSLFPTQRTVWRLPEDPEAPREEVGETGLTLGVAEGALRFNVTGPRTWHGLQPYLLLGGGGVARVGGSPEPEEVELEEGERYRFGTSFAGQIGGGVEWFATQRFTVRLDARNVLWQVRAPRAFLERDPEVPEREWTQNFWLGLGVGYRF